MHNLNARFESVLVLRAQLVERLGDQIPSNLTFDVGYYEGSQHSKIWLCTKDDLEAMYCKYPKGQITLWCNSSEAEVVGNKRKRDDSSSTTSKRQKREEDIDREFEKLKEKHGNTHDPLKLRL